MSRRELSERNVDALDAQDRGIKYYRDSNPRGLAPRISAPGKDGTVLRNYVIEYSINGRQRRLTLGLNVRSGELRLAAAPLGARVELVKAATGVDLHDEKRAHRDTTDPRDPAATFGALYDRWLAEHGARKKSARIDRSTRKKIADLEHRNACEIIRSHVGSLLRPLRDRPPAHNRALALLRTVFRFGIDEGVLSVDPSAAIKKLRETARIAALPSREVIEQIQTVLDAHPDQEGANAIRLMVFTGSRKREVLGAKWSQIDIKRRMFNKRTAKTEPQIVRVGAPALKVLTDMKRRAEARGEAGPDDFLFPGRVESTARYDLRRPWDAVREAIGKPKLRVNDLSHWFAITLHDEGAPLPSHHSTQVTVRQETLTAEYPLGGGR